MPADQLRPQPATASAISAQRRRSERRACDLAISIRLAGGEVGGRILNLSAGGAGLHINSFIALKPGQRLRLVHPDLGEVACVLRWATHPRYGAAFEASAHALARLNSLYDGLPPSADSTA